MEVSAFIKIFWRSNFNLCWIDNIDTFSSNALLLSTFFIGFFSSISSSSSTSTTFLVVFFQRNDRFLQRTDNYFQKARKQQQFSEEWQLFSEPEHGLFWSNPPNSGYVSTSDIPIPPTPPQNGFFNPCGPVPVLPRAC